jgi:hypothetical protein
VLHAPLGARRAHQLVSVPPRPAGKIRGFPPAGIRRHCELTGRLGVTTVPRGGLETHEAVVLGIFRRMPGLTLEPRGSCLHGHSARRDRRLSEGQAGVVQAR